MQDDSQLPVPAPVSVPDPVSTPAAAADAGGVTARPSAKGPRGKWTPPPAQPLVAPDNVKEANDETIAAAVELLRRGEVVAFPTETVYGLGADASNAAAVAKIFALKGRPSTHPLIVHIADVAQLDDWACDIPASARTLARKFWPGPLTLVLRRAANVSDAITGGQDTIALRIPAHPVAQQLLSAFGGGVAAPSANKFGRVSPTQAMHVFADFQLAVPLILDAGPTKVGIESTIVDCTVATPRILRPGGVAAAAIEQALGITLGEGVAGEGGEGSDEDQAKHTPRVSGSLPAHYAPRAQLKLASRIEILEMMGAHKGRRVTVLALETSVPRLAQANQRVVPVVANAYQQALYAALREFDAMGADIIIVESPPRTPGWTAVWDRLTRAAAAHVKPTKTKPARDSGSDGAEQVGARQGAGDASDEEAEAVDKPADTASASEADSAADKA